VYPFRVASGLTLHGDSSPYLFKFD